MSGLSTAVLLAFGVAILGSLVAVLVSVSRRTRADAARPPAERTPEERSRDRSTEKIWLLILLVAVALLAALYLIF